MLRERLVAKLICPAIHTGVDMNEQTCYDWTEDRLIFGYDWSADDWHFMRHLREVHGCEFADSFKFSLWSCLHEIGHHINKDVDYEDESAERFICQCAPRDCEEQIHFENLYYGLPSEWDATEWAIQWITLHPIFARFLNKIIP